MRIFAFLVMLFGLLTGPAIAVRLYLAPAVMMPAPTLSSLLPSIPQMKSVPAETAAKPTPRTQVAARPAPLQPLPATTASPPVAAEPAPAPVTKASPGKSRGQVVRIREKKPPRVVRVRRTPAESQPAKWTYQAPVF